LDLGFCGGRCRPEYRSNFVFTRGYSGEVILVQRTRANGQPQELDAASLETAIIHRDELAKLFGLKSPQMLDVQAHEEILVRAARKGWFKLGPSITRLVEHQRSVTARHSSRDGKHDVAAESAQLKAAQRRLTELKIRAMEGELVSATETLSVWGDFAKDVRAMVLSMPSRVAGELPHLVASEVEILKRLSRDMLAELKALGEKAPKVKADIT
jgi:phage terminase Nu1 subunit (DNA packaging protein)